MKWWSAEVQTSIQSDVVIVCRSELTLATDKCINHCPKKKKIVGKCYSIISEQTGLAYPAMRKMSHIQKSCQSCQWIFQHFLILALWHHAVFRKMWMTPGVTRHNLRASINWLNFKFCDGILMEQKETEQVWFVWKGDQQQDSSL